MDIRFSKGWNYAKFLKFLQIWGKWHLNDLQAGTPMQEAYLETIKDQFPGYPESHYTWASAKLHEAGLNPAPDKEGYFYGHAWLSVDVPQDVIDFLESLPDTDKTPAWI